MTEGKKREERQLKQENERHEDASPSREADEPSPGEATAPPGGGELDEEALKEGAEKLDQTGGGH